MWPPNLRKISRTHAGNTQIRTSPNFAPAISSGTSLLRKSSASFVAVTAQGPVERKPRNRSLISQGNQRAQPVIAQVKTKPDQHAENDREGYWKQSFTNAHVSSDCTAEIASQ